MFARYGLGKIGVCAVALVALALHGQAQAAPISLLNPSFEDSDPTLTSGQFLEAFPTQNVAIPGWTEPSGGTGVGVGGRVGLYYGTTEFAADRDGNNVLLLLNTATQQSSYVAQFVDQNTATVTYNYRYTLTFLLGNRAQSNILLPEFWVDVRGKRYGSGAQDSLDLISLTGDTPGNGEMKEWTAVFEVPVAQPEVGGDWDGRQLVVVFGSNWIGQGVSNEQLAIDNVRLQGELIPEPASLVLLLTGGLCLLGRRRRAAA